MPTKPSVREGSLRNRRLPSLNALRAFEAAARHQSFAAAADELGVSSAAVSQHIKALETELRVDLFHRGPHSLRLTPAASRIMPMLSGAFEAIEQATEGIRQPEPLTELTIAAPNIFAIGWLIPRIANFHTINSDIHIRVLASGGMLAPAIGLDLVDAAIRCGRGGWNDGFGIFLFCENLVPVCHPDLLRRETSRDDILLGLPRILCEEDPTAWDEWLAMRGINPSIQRQSLSFADQLLSIQAAHNGLGVALADQRLVETDLAQGRLTLTNDALPLRRGRSWFLITGRNRERTAEIRSLQDWLLHELARERLDSPRASL